MPQNRHHFTRSTSNRRSSALIRISFAISAMTTAITSEAAETINSSIGATSSDICLAVKGSDVVEFIQVTSLILFISVVVGLLVVSTFRYVFYDNWIKGILEAYLDRSIDRAISDGKLPQAKK